MHLSVNPLKKKPFPHPSLPPPHPTLSEALPSFFSLSSLPPCVLTGNNLCTSFHPPHMANSRTWRLFSPNTRKACPTLTLPDQTQTFKPSSFFFSFQSSHSSFTLFVPTFELFLLLFFLVFYFINLSSNLAAPPSHWSTFLFLYLLFRLLCCYLM